MRGGSDKSGFEFEGGFNSNSLGHSGFSYFSFSFPVRTDEEVAVLVKVEEVGLDFVFCAELFLLVDENGSKSSWWWRK